MTGFECGQRRDARRLDAAVAQQLEQALAPAFALGNDQDAVRRGAHVQLQLLQRLGGAAIDAEVGQGAGPVKSFGGVGAAHRKLRVVVAQRKEILGLQEQLFRRQDRPLAIGLQEAMTLARVDPEALERLVDPAVQYQSRLRLIALAQVIEIVAVASKNSGR